MPPPAARPARTGRPIIRIAIPVFLITILPAARAEVVEGDLDPQGADLGGLTAAFVADEDSRLLPLVEIRAADTRTYEYWVQCRLVFFDLEYSWSEGPFTLSPAETAWVDVTPPWDALIHDAQTTRPSDVIATVLGVDVEADVIALRHRLPVVHASFDADGSLTAIQGDELASAWREDPSLPPELVEAAPPEGDPNVVGAVFDGGPSLDGVAGY